MSDREIAEILIQRKFEEDVRKDNEMFEFKMKMVGAMLVGWAFLIAIL